MTEESYFYWYRIDGEPSTWIICGPYADKSQAKSLREQAKAHGRVGVVFSAASKEDAEKMTFQQ